MSTTRPVADRLVDLVGRRVRLVGEQARPARRCRAAASRPRRRPRWRCRGRGAPWACRPARSGRRRTTVGSRRSRAPAAPPRPPRRRPGRPRSGVACPRGPGDSCGDSPGLPAGLLVGVGHERVVPGGDEVLLVHSGRTQPTRDRARLDQVAELEQPRVLARPAPPGRCRAPSPRRRPATAGSAPLAPRTGLVALEQRAREQDRGLVGHRQQVRRVAPRTSRSASPSRRPRRPRAPPRTSTARRPATRSRPRAGRGSASATPAITVLSTGSSARWSAATSRKATGSSKNRSSMPGRYGLAPAAHHRILTAAGGE